MEIQPLDLGTRRGVAAIQARATAQSGNFQRGGRLSAQTPTDVRPVGAIGRWWLRGLGLDPEQQAKVLASVRGVTRGVTGGMIGGFGGGVGVNALVMGIVSATRNGSGPGPALAAIFGTVAAAGVGAGIAMPRAMLRRWIASPLTESELDEISSHAGDSLEKAFLALIRDAVRIENAPETVTVEVRSAIETLGQAIESLPAMTSSDVALDGDSLRAEADEVRARGLADADAVVSESLLRRADALERQADAIGHSAQSLRRAAALRDELGAQVEALRLGLGAYYAGGTLSSQPEGDGSLTRLASSARAVATEASALARANAELDAPHALPLRQR